MPGNHDAWLCPFYESELGARIVPDPCDLTVHGLRLHVVHGHLLGARRAWKALHGEPRVLHGLRPHSRAARPRARPRLDLEQRPQARTPMKNGTCRSSASTRRGSRGSPIWS